MKNEEIIRDLEVQVKESQEEISCLREKLAGTSQSLHDLKTSLISTGLVVLVVVLMLRYVTQDRISCLEDEYAQIESRVEKLEDSVEELSGEVEELENRVIGDGNGSGLNTRVCVLERVVEELMWQTK